MKADRRDFLVKSCAVAVGSVLSATVARVAAGTEHAHGEMTGKGGSDGYVMDSAITQRCGTCVFWGGPRRLASDGKTVTVMGLGWCNNPQSPNYQKLTSPEHGPMTQWQKWPAIGR